MRSKNNKAAYFFSAILILAILLRLSGLFQLPYLDDGLFLQIGEDKEFFSKINFHPPTGNFLTVFSTMIFGVNEWAFRLPTFLFGILTITFTYLYTRELYGKDTALWTSFFMAISAWHIYASLTNAAAEGGVMTCFIVLASYLFLREENKNRPLADIATGIAAGIAVMGKESAILIFPIFVVYLIINRKPIKQIATKTTWIFCGATIVATAFFLIDLLYNNFYTTTAIIKAATAIGIEKRSYIDPTLIHHIYSAVKILIFASPLLIFGIIGYLFTDKKQVWKKIQSFEVLFCIIMGAFFMIIISPAAEKVRYLIPLIPFLCIIAAKWITPITNNTFTKKDYIALGLLSIVILSGLMILNTERNMISYEQTDLIKENILSGKLNFDMGLISDTGNSGIVINTKPFILAYLAGLVLLASLLITKNKKYITSIMIIFLALGIGYNLFIAQEYLFHGTAPDYNRVTEEVQYLALHNYYEGPIYMVKDVSMQWYLKEKYDTFYHMDTIQNSEEKMQWFHETRENEHGTVLLVNIPFINKEGEFWNTLMTECEQDIIIEDKGMEAGYIFVC
jgi:hypothetical protein